MKSSFLIRSAAGLALSVLALAPLRAQYPIYDTQFENGFQNWSWAQTSLGDTANPAPGSTDSIDVSFNGTWQAFAATNPAGISTDGFGNLNFEINGGSVGGQYLNVLGTYTNNSAANNVASGGYLVGPLAANTWQLVSVPLAAIGVANISNFSGFWLQEWNTNPGSSSTYPGTLYVGNIYLTSSQPTIPPPPLNGDAIYVDSLVSGWQNWSWATVNLGNTSPVHTGTSSIAVTAGANYQALYLEHTNMSTVPFQSLTFWINGGSAGGQLVQVYGLLNNTAQVSYPLPALQANTWTQVTIPLSALGVANQSDFDGIWIQSDSANAQPTFYVDDMRLDFAPAPSSVGVTVNASDGIRTVDPRVFGMNTAIWDSAFTYNCTVATLSGAQIKALRFPGGSSSDTYHWATDMSDGDSFTWATSFDSFEETAQKLKPQVFITANYGSGTPGEAAAWVQYANVTKKYAVKYWEIGNEIYGTWENDTNTQPHDPVTYANRFQQYYTAMKAIDPTIKIGAVITLGEDSYVNYSNEVVTNPVTHQQHSGWTPVMLTTLKQLGCIPDFVIYHRYEQNAGGEDDTALLTAAATWPSDAANLRMQLNDYLGAAGPGVEIDCTENNSVSSNPGKQSVSLVNGLYLADSLGNLLQTEFNSLIWWDLRNGPSGSNNNSPLLYGWRQYGDYGIVDGGTTTSALPTQVYPTAEVEQLLTHFARGGETVVSASSNYWGMGAYAVDGGGTLRVLLINKTPSYSLPTTINLSGWGSFKSVTQYQYGMTQDNNAEAGTGSVAPAQTTLNASASGFTVTLPPYSATVLVIP